MAQDWSSEANRTLLARQLGNRLRELRLEADLVLDEAAAACRVSSTFLSDCERGRRIPSLSMLVAISEGYGLQLTELLSGVYPFGDPRRPRRIPKPPQDGRRSRPAPR